MINKRDFGNEIHWKPGPGMFPMTAVLRGNIFAGLFYVIFGLAWYGFLITGLRKGLAKETHWLFGIFIIMFAVIGLLMLLTGFSQIFYKRKITIGNFFVESDKRGILGKGCWKETRSNYSRVEKAFFRRSRYGLAYSITLKHAQDPEKDIVLYQSASSLLLDKKLAQLSKIFP